MKTMSIVLPAYNEEQMIEKTDRDNRPADGE